MYDPYTHECIDVAECWFWWLGMWIGSGEPTPEYNEVVANELYDFHGLLSGLGVLYDEITGGRVSKPNTSKRVVAELVEERLQEHGAEMWDEGHQVGIDDCDTG